MSIAVPMSREDFLARPDRDDDQCEELIEGEVIVSPGAKVWHADIVRHLRDELALLKQQGYVVANGFSCILGTRSMPVPDLAAMRKERFDLALKNDGWLEGAPELVVEVASPSNRKLHHQAKIYLQHGAEQVWIVHRKTRTVTVVTPAGTTEARLGETLEFHGVELAVASIFPDA